MEIPDIVGEANDFVTTTNLIRFKVDMEDSSSGNYNVMLKVFVDDQDVQEMSFDELSHSSIRIKVFNRSHFGYIVDYLQGSTTCNNLNGPDLTRIFPLVP